MDYTIVIKDHISRGPERPGDDGVTAIGVHHKYLVLRSIYDWRGCPVNTQDEVLSSVDGASVTLKGVLILGGIKAILAGNDDHPINDSKFGRWELEDCIIIGSGRRCPEVQDGVKLSMKRCWIHDWGQTFDVRAFGAWAHRGGCIVAEDCVFTQSSGRLGLGLRNTLVDLGNHVGQAFNDHGWKALFQPGTYQLGISRGLTSDSGGSILATRCYRNHSWIRVDNCAEFLSYEEASKIIAQIEPNLHKEYKEHLGKSALELFSSLK